MSELFIPKESKLVVNDNARDVFFEIAEPQLLIELLNTTPDMMSSRNPVLTNALVDSVRIKRDYFEDKAISQYYSRAFMIGSFVSYFVYSLNEPEDPILDTISYKVAINKIDKDNPSYTWKEYLYRDTNLNEIISVVADSLCPDNMRARDYIDDGSGCVSYFLNYQYNIKQQVISN